MDSEEGRRWIDEYAKCKDTIEVINLKRRRGEDGALCVLDFDAKDFGDGDRRGILPPGGGEPPAPGRARAPAPGHRGLAHKQNLRAYARHNQYAKFTTQRPA